jgi:hypothetical protein
LAGGDALGALIAGNAANWGVSVAPELLATTAGVAAGAAGGGGSGTTSLLSKAATGASAANAGLGLVNAVKGTKTPAAPAVTPVRVMPSPDDATVLRAKAAALSAMRSRRGRQSTILSNDSLGGN